MSESAGSWPVVDPHDNGIRPAGRPDECFYCNARVGSKHAHDCVVVTRRVEVRVRATLPSGDVFEGTWQLDTPYFWDAAQVEFHHNESSWCASNLLDECDKGTVAWDAGDPWSDLEALHGGGDCLCQRLDFTFQRVVDGTPKRKLRTPPTSAMN